MNIDDFIKGLKDSALETGKEDYRKTHYRERELKGQETEADMFSDAMANHPLLMTGRESTGTMNEPMRTARQETGMGLSDNPVIRSGQQVGAVAYDLMNDSSRNIWWLLNAPQASVSVLNDFIIKKANPELYQTTEALNKKGKPIPQIQRDSQGNIKNTPGFQDAINYEMENRLAKGLIDRESGTMRKGVSLKDGNYAVRNYSPGGKQALTIPAALAVNAGMGVLNPFGGTGGYEAALPSQEDPTKTSNVIGEVAMKYILGRTGNLLPYEEFSKVRPDVSRDEYNAYKAFKYDKDLDLNLTDGDFTLPAGALKGTMDGIHGPEIQFLGRSLPLLTTLLPTAGAIAGTAAGVRYNMGKGKTAIRDGLIGGGAGLAVSTTAGLIAEEARRRAGSVANNELEGQ